MRGRTITLQHNVTLPTPYDRLNSVRGTKGVFKDYPARFYFDGQQGGHRFRPVDEFKAEYTHPLWQRVGEIARAKGGHGGMDYIMAFRLIECMREGTPPDFDVYDAAAWSAPWPLSEASLKRRSAPMNFPDFTRGGWQRAADGRMNLNTLDWTIVIVTIGTLLHPARAASPSAPARARRSSSPRDRRRRGG